MIIRLRSRDGLERIEVADNGTLQSLKQAIHQKLNIPWESMQLSKNAQLLTSKRHEDFQDLSNNGLGLRQAGVQHGDMIFLWYPFEREVEPTYKKTAFEAREFGAHITVSDVVAKQTRIERQEKGHVESVSFDRAAAVTFQQYVQAALAFSIKRGGLLYGTVDEAHRVRVELIYEPPQRGSAESLQLERGTSEEAAADALAASLGYCRVGWIFAQSTQERDFIMSAAELVQVARMQSEVGESCVTVVVSFEPNDAGGHIHFEAFQCSEQAVRLVNDGWFVEPQPELSGVAKMQNPKEPDLKTPVIVAGKDVEEVDTDWFLCPLKILDHEGPLTASFPVENRLTGQSKSDLREALRRGGSSRPYQQRLADFHLLLWLAKQPNLEPSDVEAVAAAVRDGHPLLEGYTMLIDSIAGL